MRPLAAHCNLLSEALSGIGGQNHALYDVSSYLQLASGIRNVHFSTWEFEQHPGICESADDYRDQQDKLWGLLTQRISVFLFVWAAVEAYKAELTLVAPPKDGGTKPRQIDKLCYYLSIQYKFPLPEKLCDVISVFRSVAAQSNIGRHAASKTLIPGYITPAGEGLYLVYEYRNAFAHGDFSAPFPEGDPSKHPDLAVVALATRLVLLSLQMITLCRYPPDEPMDVPSLLRFSDEEDPLSVKETFLKLHMKSFGC